VLAVAAVVVGVVLGLAVVTSVLPAGLQDVIFRTPLAIVVLVIGTIGLLVWLARRPHPEA
jgi:threonine/homoserine/homoserine lactone efflux protein